MIFSSPDPDTNGRAFLDAVARELACDPRWLALRAIPHGAPPEPGLVNGLAHMLSWAPTGTAPYIHALVVEGNTPGPWGVTLHVARTAGLNVVGARLAFAARLQGSIAQNTVWKGGGFAGDQALSNSLNADQAFIAHLRRHLRHEMTWGTIRVSLPIYSSIVKQGDGVTFVLGTMPEIGRFSLGPSTFHIRALIDLAARVQWHVHAARRG